MTSPPLIAYNIRMKLLIFLFTVYFFFVSICFAAKSPAYSPSPIIAKWYDNHTGAISLTYDDGAPYSELNRTANKFVLENGLSLDYEIVTYDYLRNPDIKKYLLHRVIPSGLGYFGHGHQHQNHDQLSYEEALKSFKRCYEALKELGLKPVAYAYPNGAGHKPETQKALADSGFLAGRLHYSEKMTAPYLLADKEKEPANWFALPTLVMQDFSFSKCKRCVGNDEQLIPYLDETLKKTAWIILTYHAIGDENGYGFFKYSEFQKNVASIKARDFWCASMNTITLYIRERLNATVRMTPLFQGKKCREISIIVSDSLPNDIYSQPLTIVFTIPPDWIGKTISLIENGKEPRSFLFQSREAKVSIAPDETEKKFILSE